MPLWHLWFYLKIIVVSCCCSIYNLLSQIKALVLCDEEWDVILLKKRKKIYTCFLPLQVYINVIAPCEIMIFLFYDSYNSRGVTLGVTYGHPLGRESIWGKYLHEGWCRPSCVQILEEIRRRGWRLKGV
jgi:hypothetical protein